MPCFRTKTDQNALGRTITSITYISRYRLHHTIHAKQHLTGITDNNRIALMTELLHH